MNKLFQSILAIITAFLIVTQSQRVCEAVEKCAEDGSDSQYCWTENSDYISMVGNGCPDHSWFKLTPNDAKHQDHDVKFPKQARRAANPVNIGINGTPLMGPIGFALNSVPLYGPANNVGEDAYITEAHTFDDCLSHSDACSNYHYHTETKCHMDNLRLTNHPEKHSPIFAIMIDGVPLFGSRGAGGVAPTDLDECGGHIGSGDDEYPFYHYHTPGSHDDYDLDDVNNANYPYTLDKVCGCIHENHEFGNSADQGIPSANTGDTCELHANQTGWQEGDAIWSLLEDTVNTGNCALENENTDNNSNNGNHGNSDDIYDINDEDDGEQLSQIKQFTILTFIITILII